MHSGVHLYRSPPWSTQGSASGYTAIAVFQSSSGQTGFDAEETGKQLVREMLTDAWICSAGGDSIGPLGETQDPLKVIARSPSRICFHGPTHELFGEFERIKSYLSEKRISVLKAKYQKVIEQSASPRLKPIICDSQVNQILIFEWLQDLCEMVSVWPIDNSGYGFYGKFFTRQEAVAYKLKQQCEKTGVDVTMVENLEQLPVW